MAKPPKIRRTIIRKQITVHGRKFYGSWMDKAKDHLYVEVRKTNHPGIVECFAVFSGQFLGTAVLMPV